MSRLYEYYDVTGGANVITSAMPDVFHYDQSTFYNYAQDNLSVSSLEKRFDTLAQGLGFPGSATYSGVTFLVSSTATPNSDIGHYSSLQSAVDDLPRVLNYPVNIEVADYGDLGALSCVGIKCHGDGAIQIHVLNYASTDNSRVAGVSVYGDISSVSSVTSSGLTSAITTVTDYRTSTSLFSAANWKSNGRMFSQTSPDSQKETQVISCAAASSGDWTFSSASSTFITENYLTLSAYDRSVSADVAPTTQNNSAALLGFRRTPVIEDRAASVMFGAYLTSLHIRDCNKIKLKGVLVDGFSGTGPIAYSSWTRQTPIDRCPHCTKVRI